MGLNNDMEVKKENLVKEDSDATKKGKADDKGKIVADAKTYSIVKTTDGKSAPAQVVPAAGAASVTPTSVTTTAAKTATTTATPTTTSTTTTPPATTTTTAAKTTETTPSSTSTVDTNKSH